MQEAAEKEAKRLASLSPDDILGEHYNSYELLGDDITAVRIEKSPLPRSRILALIAGLTKDMDGLAITTANEEYEFDAIERHDIERESALLESIFGNRFKPLASR